MKENENNNQEHQQECFKYEDAVLILVILSSIIGSFFPLKIGIYYLVSSINFLVVKKMSMTYFLCYERWVFNEQNYAPVWMNSYY